METNNTAEQRKNRREERLNSKLNRAKDPTSMIITARTRRVATLINLLEQTDIAIGRIQNSVGDNIAMADAEAIFNEFRTLVLAIDDFTQKILKVSNGRYFESAGIKNLRKIINDNTDTKPEVATEKKGGKK